MCYILYKEVLTVPLVLLCIVHLLLDCHNFCRQMVQFLPFFLVFGSPICYRIVILGGFDFPCLPFLLSKYFYYIIGNGAST